MFERVNWVKSGALIGGFLFILIIAFFFLLNGKTILKDDFSLSEVTTANRVEPQFHKTVFTKKVRSVTELWIMNMDGSDKERIDLYEDGDKYFFIPGTFYIHILKKAEPNTLFSYHILTREQKRLNFEDAENSRALLSIKSSKNISPDGNKVYMYVEYEKLNTCQNEFGESFECTEKVDLGEAHPKGYYLVNVETGTKDFNGNNPSLEYVWSAENSWEYYLAKSSDNTSNEFFRIDSSKRKFYLKLSEEEKYYKESFFLPVNKAYVTVSYDKESKESKITLYKEDKKQELFVGLIINDIDVSPDQNNLIFLSQTDKGTFDRVMVKIDNPGVFRSQVKSVKFPAKIKYKWIDTTHVTYKNERNNLVSVDVVTNQESMLTDSYDIE